jgi:hypothetical protein
VIRHVEALILHGDDDEILDALEEANKLMRSHRTALQNAEHTYLKLYNAARDRHLVEPFRGTENKPVVVESLEKIRTIEAYSLNHVHNPEGKCLKNRFADPAKCEVPNP